MAALKRTLWAPLVGRCRCLSLSARGFNSKNGESEQFKPPPKPIIIDELKQQATEKRFLSPEFIPPRQRTNHLKFFLERQYMIKRRKVINIPEFYAGSILAVSAMDLYSNGKCNTFVGICIQRSGNGLGATFKLRNVINGQGVEICYELYNPLIHEIKVLKLEKRPDDNLMYLRDALPEFSTVDVNMKPVSYILYDEVPVNKMKVKMKPKPWSKRWEHPKYNIQGINFDDYLTEKDKQRIKKWEMPWRQFDMMLEYDTSKFEKEIQKEVNEELNKS
ncbi:39S ribosomal protein L19, mitochondrial [Ophiophagus hannah]|uniref:Large ribosomal subunit protein bL19m n=1 Tax=Ophiophagus hannah TaxID=8665 RepID=V8P1Y9_OPHHA|nr:39S ribosomal protein L19, mitochondrial [Ophiophagus hannah]